MNFYHARSYRPALKGSYSNSQTYKGICFNSKEMRQKNHLIVVIKFEMFDFFYFLIFNFYHTRSCRLSYSNSQTYKFRVCVYIYIYSRWEREKERTLKSQAPRMVPLLAQKAPPVRLQWSNWMAWASRELRVWFIASGQTSLFFISPLYVVCVGK